MEFTPERVRLESEDESSEAMQRRVVEEDWQATCVYQSRMVRFVEHLKTEEDCAKYCY